MCASQHNLFVGSCSSRRSLPLNRSATTSLPLESSGLKAVSEAQDNQTDYCRDRCDDRFACDTQYERNDHQDHVEHDPPSHASPNCLFKL